MSDRVPVWVLLSGGLDSATCLLHFQRLGHPVCGLFVEYGQAAVAKERVAVREISNRLLAPLSILRCDGFPAFGAGEVRGRNAFFLFAALMAMGETSGVVAIGVHAGTPYQDCGEPFFRLMRSASDLYTGGRVQMAAPFLHWTKKEVWDYGSQLGLPVELTYSCELGLEQPCGRCSSCSDRAKLVCS